MAQNLCFFKIIREKLSRIREVFTFLKHSEKGRFLSTCSTSNAGILVFLSSTSEKMCIVCSFRELYKKAQNEFKSVRTSHYTKKERDTKSCSVHVQ